MNTSFIPSFHLDTTPANKLTPEWCKRVIDYCYYNTANYSLLHNKKCDEIEEFATGNINMRVYKKLYKSLQKKYNEMPQNVEKGIRATGIPDDEFHFIQLPLIPTPLNSAISILSKPPMEISCTALDPLAATKKTEDITFLKNKSKFEGDMEKLTAQMNIPKIDLGTTQHSAIPYADSPFGLDLNDPDDLEVFANILYKLGVESSFETILQTWIETKNIAQIKLREIRDQFWYGVSVNTTFENKITGLPDIKYEWPGNIYVPNSDLPDYSDTPHRYTIEMVTPMELFDFFGNEICDKETLAMIVNGGAGIGAVGTDSYCACNGMKGGISHNEFNTFKMCLVRFEVKSVDWVGVMANPKSKKEFKYIMPEGSDMQKCTDKIWGQNTYVFYWLRNTKYFFGIDRLGYASRSEGREAYQNFSTNIYKSQEKSAVENSIGENRTAQIAYIKYIFEIVQSRPSGMYIDLKYMRGALDGLTDEDSGKTITDLTTLATEKNNMIADTTGFDGKNDGQFKPFEKIPGGLTPTVIGGYLQVIQTAKVNIADFTGINQQLTGQSPDPNTLVGYQKLQINASLNSLYYANQAVESQYQKVMNQWGYQFQRSIKRGGKVKQAIVSLIGGLKTGILSRLQEITLHSVGIKVNLNSREEERQEYTQKVYALRAQGVLNAVDEFLLKYIPNMKDRFGLLAVREKQFLKRQDKIRQENYANSQALSQQQGKNMIDQENAATDGKIKQVYAKGDVQSKIIPLQQQLVNQSKQVDALIQKSLQEDRNRQQTEKAVRTLQEKANIDNQKSAF